MIEVIPAIDLIDGKCVRLSQGDFNTSKIYSENPLEMAKAFEGIGIKRLHLVDLDGAKHKKVKNLATLQAITSNTNLVVDFGGGIQSNDDLKKVIDAGAEMVTCGSIALKNRPLFEEWLERYGPERIILAADTKDGKIAVHGWQETASVTLDDFISDFLLKGIKYFLCTDISKDGMLSGPAFSLYNQIQINHPSIKLIASGGISNMDDIRQLNTSGIFGVVVGKAYYEGKIALEDFKEFVV
ncbi:1-(5-phosphoribosyl)-5-[(5-phosphoribosylamino)methylideneamino]imidazole-4-carboxamide isomerase [Flammeovirgaceae bacterium SG7u.111]|nr:1-(5-phosphoribosyl)-5-[(5-phosphoribosylamino)methylideneamino]imidazole-4-carboxamide isomerase [Flammeovirgaceae bacterium SG7u.132]WPO38484.1 1-(5-phosphoribosyl)-5-[(5-phosphoribosylamino)methylideneamino]imidazole-4-carboxamide isomerase [Flammeovirgaceae bacterium SG7u.111]